MLLKRFHLENWERLLQLPKILGLLIQKALRNARQLKQET